MSSLALLLVLAALVLPLRLHAQQRECVVAARAIARGTVLSRADLSVVREAQCHVATLAADALPGMVARRLIRVGEPLHAPAVAPVPAVAAGTTARSSDTAPSSLVTGPYCWRSPTCPRRS